MAHDTYYTPQRTDTAGKAIDNHLTQMKADGTPQRFAGVKDGGQLTETAPLVKLTTFAAANGSGSSAITFDEQSKANGYIVEYWLTNVVGDKKHAILTASGQTIAGIAAGSYTFRGRAFLEYGEGNFCYGDWSDTDTATIS